MKLSWTFFVAAVLLSPQFAAAQEEPALDMPVPDANSEGSQKEAKVTFGGRIFVQNQTDRIDETWSNDIILASARLGARYRSAGRKIRIEVEGEFGRGRASAKNAYLRYRPVRWFQVQAGRFKRPIGGIALASRWDLPTIERGLLTDIEVDGVELPIGRRADGFMLGFLLKDTPLKPQIYVGLFRGEVHELADIRLDLDDGFTEDAYARAQISPARGLILGLSGGYFSYFGTLGELTVEHGAVGSADIEYVNGMVRAWAEVFAGNSPFAIIPSNVVDTIADGAFYAGRMTLGLRIALDGLRFISYIEPYGSVQALDASTASPDRGALEASFGVNAGFGKRWRLQVGGRQVWAEDLAPTSDYMAVLVQVAALFPK